MNSLVDSLKSGTISDTPPPAKHSYLLFGKTGAGKSTVLNALQRTIKFKTSDGLDSCTEVAQWVKSPFSSFPSSQVLHIEIPGFYDPRKSQLFMQQQLTKMVEKVEGGVTCFLFVISILETKFDGSLLDTLKKLGELYGESAYERCKIVFTHIDELSFKHRSKKEQQWSDYVKSFKSKHNINISRPFFIFDYSLKTDALRELQKYVLNFKSNFFPKLRRKSGIFPDFDRASFSKELSKEQTEKLKPMLNEVLVPELIKIHNKAVEQNLKLAIERELLKIQLEVQRQVAIINALNEMKKKALQEERRQKLTDGLSGLITAGLLLFALR